MAKGSTSNFLQVMNERNARIAAREKSADVGVDPARLQREEERRERWGTLRAREHWNNQPKRVTTVFGFTDLS